MKDSMTRADYLLLARLKYDDPPVLGLIESRQAEKLVRLGYAERHPTQPRLVRRTDQGERALRMRQKTARIEKAAAPSVRRIKLEKPQDLEIVLPGVTVLVNGNELASLVEEARRARLGRVKRGPLVVHVVGRLTGR